MINDLIGLEHVTSVATRRDCKMIKQIIVQRLHDSGYTLYRGCWFDDDVIIHNAFCKAIDEYEEYGIIPVSRIWQITDEECDADIERMKNTFAEYVPFEFKGEVFQKTKDVLEEAQKVAEKKLREQGYCNGFQDADIRKILGIPPVTDFSGQTKFFYDSLDASQ